MTESTASSDHVFKDGDVLVVYASTHGHTGRIVTRLSDAMREEGLAVDLREAAQAADASPGRYDLVIVAGSLHQEHHQKAIVEWVTKRRDALAEIPSVFISVSLSAAEDTEESRTATQRSIGAFIEQTGWTPGRSEAIAGALQYREYDFFTRQVMRLLMRKMGHPTDTSHDYDYTDWDGVDGLGRELAEDLKAAAGPPA